MKGWQEMKNFNNPMEAWAYFFKYSIIQEIYGKDKSN